VTTIRSDRVRGHPALIENRAPAMPHRKQLFTLLCAVMVVCLADRALADADAPGPTPDATPSSASAAAQPLNNLFELEPLAKARYYFQSNTGGRGRAEFRLTLGRNDRRHHTQFNINIPITTSYAPTRLPKTGLGNISLLVNHAHLGEGSSQSVGVELWLPTATNGVRSNDTELRPMYGLRWTGRRSNFSFTLDNTFAQSIIVPPGSTWTSYYDFRMAAAPYAGNGTFAVLYEGRFLFTLGGTYASAIGPNVVAKLWPGATLNAYDIWGIGASGQTNLWRYKAQFTLTQRL
jgi:hypothetical protein